MAGEFHHNLRGGGDANGEHEANESLAATVGCNLGVFGNSDVVAAALTEASNVDGVVKSAELADLLQILVHLLVGDDGQGQVSRKIIVLVLVQNSLGIAVELDLEAGVCLLSDDRDGSVLNIVFVEVGHVRVAEASEGAEAEEVPGLCHGAGLFDFFFIFLSGHVHEFDFLAGLGNLVIIELQEFVVRQEYDGLGRNLKDGMIGSHIREMGVAVSLAPVEEGCEVLILLADRAVLQLQLEAEELHIGGEAFLVEEAKRALLVELPQLILEGLVRLGCLERPAHLTCAFLEILIHIAVGGWGGFLQGRFFGILGFLLQGIVVFVSFMELGQMDVAGVKDPL